MQKNVLVGSLTVIGYAFIIVYAMCAITLGIAYATGYFNPVKNPVAGLKFVSATATIDSTGGTTEGIIVGKDTVITTQEDGTITLEDPSDATQVRLTVRNYAGMLYQANCPITIPEIVTTGQKFTITANINEEDGFNIGGDCKIYAETVDGVFVGESALNVFVDVPIESINVMASSIDNSVNEIDLTTAQLIKDDTIKLNASVFPTRSLNPHSIGVTAPNKTIYFATSDSLLAEVGQTSGDVTVLYNPPTAEASQVTFTVSAVSVYSGTTPNVIQTCNMSVYPILLKDIKINNPAFIAEDQTIMVDLFDENSFVFSLQETGNENIHNLNIFLEPEYYTPTSNADPLSAQLNTMDIRAYVEMATPLSSKTLVTVEEQDAISYNGRYVQVWAIKAHRNVEEGEVARLSMSCTVGGVEKTIYRNIEISYDTPTGFSYTGVTDKSISLQIEKKPDNSIKNGASQAVGYTYSNEGFTFEKFVFFIDYNAGLNNNETGSAIIESGDYGQILDFSQDGNLGSFNITAQGAGNLSIIPYVVRTNARGEALDKSYNIITEATGITRVENQAEANDGEYIAYQVYDAISIKVTELLTSLTLFTDPELKYPLESTPTSQFYFGAGNNNKLSVYAKPNSPLALPKAEDAPSWEAQNGEIFFDVADNLENDDITISQYPTYGQIFADQDEDVSFNRYISFEITTLIERDVSVHVKRGTSELARMNLFAETIAVNNILLDDSNTSVISSYDWYGNIRSIKVAVGEVTERIHNNANYYKVNWVTNKKVNGTIQGTGALVLPESSGTSNRFNLVPTNPTCTPSLYMVDKIAKYDFTKYDEPVTITAIINTLDTDLTTQQIAEKYQIINEHLLSAEEYATIVSNTIQFFKPLPTNSDNVYIYDFYVQYVASDGEGESKPFYLNVAVEYPTVTFGTINVETAGVSAPAEGYSAGLFEIGEAEMQVTISGIKGGATLIAKNPILNLTGWHSDSANNYYDYTTRTEDSQIIRVFKLKNGKGLFNDAEKVYHYGIVRTINFIYDNVFIPNEGIKHEYVLTDNIEIQINGMISPTT